jgi:hypothetical protein
MVLCVTLLYLLFEYLAASTLSLTSRKTSSPGQMFVELYMCDFF